MQSYTVNYAQHDVCIAACYAPALYTHSLACVHKCAYLFI